MEHRAHLAFSVVALVLAVASSVAMARSADEGEPGGALVVSVVDADGGAPVSDVHLWFWRGAGRGGGVVTAVTDAAGRATLRVPAEQAGELRTVRGGRLVEIVRLPLGGFAAGERREETLAVAVERRIAGRVVATDGGGVARAHVRFQSCTSRSFRPGDSMTVYETHVALRTRDDGSFEATVPAWQGLIGRVDAAGCGPAFFRPGDDATIELRPGATLRGRVDGALGTLTVHVVAESGVMLVGEHSFVVHTGEPSWSARPDDDGAWTIGDLPAGRELRVELRRGRTVLRDAIDVTLEPLEERNVAWPDEEPR